MTRSARSLRSRSAVLKHTLLLPSSLVVVVPLLILINVAFKPASEVNLPLSLPHKITLQNFTEVWSQADLGSALMNSIIVTTVGVAGVILLSSLCSYALSRSLSRYGNAVYLLFILGLIVPFQLGMVPVYSTFRDLGLLGNIWGVVIFNIGVQMPLSVFIYTTFLRAMDRDYEDAAAIDGCGSWRTFWSIVFPLARPVTATIVIFLAISSWNDFFPPLLLLGGQHPTVPVALYGLASAYYTNWSVIFAGLIISMLPILVLYFALQRNVIEGFSGGLKGG